MRCYKTNPFRYKKRGKAHKKARQKPGGEKNRDALKRCKYRTGYPKPKT
jgi:hypothetical protein